MRIVLGRSGGFAAVPALSRKWVVDTETLAPADRAEVERLAAAADLTSPAVTASPPAGAADGITYELTVTGNGAQTTGIFHTPIPDPDLARLVAHVERLARGGAEK